MDKFQVLQSFWGSFGIPAYDVNTVPTGDNRPSLPYITYNVVVSDLGSPVAMSASLWYYGTSWEPITAKLNDISFAIGRGGRVLPVNDGAVWLKKGVPFAQRMSDPDDMIRRILINIEAEYLTAD